MLRDLIRKIVKGTISAARTNSGEFLLKKTDYGLVSVEYVTVQKIAERALAELKEIGNPQVVVEKNASPVTPIKIQLTLTLTEGFSAPHASEAADKAINAAIKKSLEPGFYVPVAVKVEQIDRQVATKKRRVR